MNTPGSIRAFVGIPLDADAGAELDEAVARLQTARRAGSVRWVAGRNRHLTLAFLGQVPVAAGMGLMASLERAAAGLRPFPLALCALGGFPGDQSPIIAARVELSAPLLALYQTLRTSCQEHGLPREERPFNPHITLGRDKSGHFRMPKPVKLSITMHASCVALFQSDLTPQGSEYTILSGVELGKS